MAQLKQVWEKRGCGSIIGSNSEEKQRITFAMFADDTTLVARSRRSLTRMILEICDALAKIGLNVNPEKCSIHFSIPHRATSLSVGELH